MQSIALKGIGQGAIAAWDRCLGVYLAIRPLTLLPRQPVAESQSGGDRPLPTKNAEHRCATTKSTCLILYVEMANSCRISHHELNRRA